jgi:hypothetical protein
MLSEHCFLHSHSRKTAVETMSSLEIALGGKKNHGIQRKCAQINNFLKNPAWVVSHTCNPSYSESRDQEDHGWRSAWANSVQKPYLEKTQLKKGLME